LAISAQHQASTKTKKAKSQARRSTDATVCLPSQQGQQPVPKLEPQLHDTDAAWGFGPVSEHEPQEYDFNAMLEPQRCELTPPEYLAPATPVGGVAQTPGSFPKHARGGGNMTYVKESNREIQVSLNQDGVALWVPRNSYATQIFSLKGFIESLPGDAISRGEIQHPLLQVSGVRIPLDVSDMMERQIYGHRKPGNKAFNQLLSYLGMRSNIDKMAKVRILTFDPEAWNRMGVRLIKGGDSKGGKPKIVYVR
jgi:hypothetical protein